MGGSVSVARTRVVSEEDDAALIARVAGGDVSALGAAFDRWHRDVYAFLARLRGTREDVDDLVQATFVALPEAATNWTGESSARAFVLGVALQHARRERRRFFRRLALWRARASDLDLPPEGPDPERSAADHEDLARLQRALQALPEAQRETLLLVEVEGLKGEDAARAMGIPVNTVWTRLHHAQHVAYIAATGAAMSAIECVRAAEVEAALDERLPEAQAHEALQHVRTCARCREAHAELTALRRLSAALPGGAPDELASRRMRAAVLGAVLRPAPVVKRGRAMTFAVAAAALALAAFGARALRRPTEPVTARRADTVVTEASPAAISLGGAGTLWPAADARVFVRSAGPDTHIELAAGRIDLQVTHRRAGERFVVTTADAEVEVHGTRFQVEARDGRLRRVDVSEGVVAVRCEGEAERLLVAGAHLVLPEETPPAPAPVAPAQVVTPPPAQGRPPAVRPDPGGAFRAGSLAFVQGDHAGAAENLQRFLAQSSRADPRREDARYVLVLALHAARREAEMERAAWAFLAEFPRGLRRAEVVVALVRSLAARAACDDAARAALALPEDADARFRAPVTRALQACR